MTSVAEKLQKKSGRPRAVKQVRLKLVYIDVWSALKLSFLLALCLGIVTVVASMLIFIVLNQTGILIQLDQLFRDILNQPEFTLSDQFNFAGVVSIAAVVAAINTVVFTVLGAIAALLYNLAVKITGGALVGFTNA